MMRTGRGRKREQGLTLIELVSCSAIVLILASVAIPVANNWVKRRKELELRQALREIRTAIDKFQWDVDHTYPVMAQKLNGLNASLDHYPEKIEWLYEGFDIGDAAGTKVKYLRRLPRDPITGKPDWVLRSSHDQPGSFGTDGLNIFDVHSASEALALDGTPYAEW